jgi:hypothetical protein
MLIDLGPGATISPGDLLALKEGALRSKNSISLPSTSTSIVSAPLIPQQPSVSLKGAQVGLCSCCRWICSCGTAAACLSFEKEYFLLQCTIIDDFVCLYYTEKTKYALCNDAHTHGR